MQSEVIRGHQRSSEVITYPIAVVPHDGWRLEVASPVGCVPVGKGGCRAVVSTCMQGKVLRVLKPTRRVEAIR